MPSEKNFDKGIQKLDESDLEKVSAGSTGIADVSSFFKRDRIDATCNTCGNTTHIQIPKKNMGEWRIQSGMNGIYVALGLAVQEQRAEVDWKCENCGQKNHTSLYREGNRYSTGPWHGHTS